jgi:NAD(P)-dependent dehydrogenase (short-subunit alcohol dehydrogenase family)
MLVSAESKSLAGCRVLVTGAASGIGLEILRRCVAEGAAVAAIDRDRGGLEEAVAGLAATSGVEVSSAVADVADPEQVRRAVGRLGAEPGGLTGIVNCAGVAGYTGDVGATSLEQWERMLAVNLTGVFLVCREGLRFLRNKGGRIVNISSQYGLVGGSGIPAYGASKAGVIGLTRAMAVDHASERILVNCVCPGPVDTPMLRAGLAARARRGTESTPPSRRPLLGAPGRPEDVAGVVTFLLGRDAGYITGSIISVDGGWTAG